MPEQEYIQAPLPDPAETAYDAPGRGDDPDYVESPAIASDPDFWPEFYNEWNFREQHDLPPVGPVEFSQMRDWADGVPMHADKAVIFGDAMPARGTIFGDATVAEVDTHPISPIMERLQTGIESAMTAEGFKAFLETQAKFHNYSPYNAMLIGMQNPEATRVAGFNKWKEMGRQVRKGEQGIRILAPMIKMIDEEESGTKVKAVTGFKTVSVFDIAQTDGPPLPEAPHPEQLNHDDPLGDELFSRLKDFVTAGGIDVLKGPLYLNGREANGAYSPREKAIVINYHLEGDQEVKTFTHEVAHLLAEHRAGVNVEDAETVAESSAFVTLSHFGLDTSDYTMPYVTAWAKEPEVFKRNIGEIQKVSNMLIYALRDGCPPAEGEQ